MAQRLPASFSNCSNNFHNNFNHFRLLILRLARPLFFGGNERVRFATGGSVRLRGRKHNEEMRRIPYRFSGIKKSFRLLAGIRKVAIATTAKKRKGGLSERGWVSEYLEESLSRLARPNSRKSWDISRQTGIPPKGERGMRRCARSVVESLQVLGPRCANMSRCPVVRHPFEPVVKLVQNSLYL